MRKRKVVIDTLGNNKFVMMNHRNEEFIITAKIAYQHYLNCQNKMIPIEFTKKALDEIQNAIEEELLRKEKSSAASYASTNAKVFR